MTFFRFRPPSPTNLDRFKIGTSSFSMIGRFSWWFVRGWLSVAFIMSIIRALASDTTKRLCTEWLHEGKCPSRQLICTYIGSQQVTSKCNRVLQVRLKSRLDSNSLSMRWFQLHHVWASTVHWLSYPTLFQLDDTAASFLQTVKFKEWQKYEKAKILWHFEEKANTMTIIEDEEKFSPYWNILKVLP